MRFLRGKWFVLACLLAVAAGVELSGGGLMGWLWGRDWFSKTVVRMARSVDVAALRGPLPERDRGAIVDAAIAIAQRTGPDKGLLGAVTLTQLEALHGSGLRNLTYRAVYVMLHPRLERVVRMEGSGAVGADAIALLNAKGHRQLLIDLSRYPGDRRELRVFHVSAAGVEAQVPLADAALARSEGILLVEDARAAAMLRVRAADGKTIVQARLDEARHALFDAQEAALKGAPPVSSRPPERKVVPLSPF